MSDIKTDIAMEFIPKSEIDLMSKKKDVEMTGVDAEQIMENKKILLKFLDKAKVARQAWLWLGKYKGVEEKIYDYIECVDELKSSMEVMDKQYSSYKKKMLEAEKEKKKKFDKSKATLKKKVEE